MTPAQIRSLRDRLQLTQQELADRLGLSPANGRTLVSHWEAGRKVPRGPALVLLDRLVFDAEKKSRKK